MSAEDLRFEQHLEVHILICRPDFQKTSALQDAEFLLKFFQLI